MKRLLGIVGALLALGIPALAQSQYPNDRDYDRGYGQAQARMSPDDQREFNKEYERWQRANASSDRDDIDKHARRMEEIMARYNIPQDTPFQAIATSNGYARPNNDVGQFQGRFSADDQKKYDKAYEHWLHDRRKHDRDDVARDEDRMQEIMARYNIPRNVPYDSLASGSRGY